MKFTDKILGRVRRARHGYPNTDEYSDRGVVIVGRGGDKMGSRRTELVQETVKKATRNQPSDAEGHVKQSEWDIRL